MEAACFRSIPRILQGNPTEIIIHMILAAIRGVRVKSISAKIKSNLISDPVNAPEINGLRMMPKK